jgi:GT2 family glycosyltransferase
VSLVIVLYNAAPFIPRLIAALRRQTYPHLQYVFVDNCSTDDGATIIARTLPEATLVRLEDNRGFAAGCNAALPHCRGAYLAFLNPDTEPEPGWIAPLVTAMEAEPAIGLATAKILVDDDRARINTCGIDVHLAGFATCRGLGAPATAYTHAADVASVSGAAFAIRRDLMERLGGFDESFFMYVEDTDLSWRAVLLGARCRYVPESVVAHHYALTLSPRKTWYLERNRVQMLLKCYQWRSLLLLAPALVLGECCAWGFAALRGPAYLKAKADAVAWLVRHGQEIRAQRRRVQATRVVGDRAILCLATPRLPVAVVHRNALADAAERLLRIPFAILRRIAFAAGQP